MVNPQDVIAPNEGPETEHVFPQGRTHDVNVQPDLPDAISPDLRGNRADHNKACAICQDAAQMARGSPQQRVFSICVTDGMKATIKYARRLPNTDTRSRLTCPARRGDGA